MPNIKSAKKRVLVNAKKAEENKAIRSSVKTEIKKVELLVKNNELENIKEALACAFSVIDSACAKNIYHANNAANKKAKLAKKVDKALKNANVVKEEVKEEKVEVVEEVAPIEEAPKKAKKTSTAKKTASKKADNE